MRGASTQTPRSDITDPSLQRDTHSREEQPHLEGIGDLVGQTLLHLWSARELLDDPASLERPTILLPGT